MKVENSQGKIWYGVHMYPGVAEYRESDREPYRVFLNENTIRRMDPTFAGRPVFVMHVDGVSTDLHSLRNEADGWVVESFFNEADGKHWVKFITVSEEAERAIKNGMRLSNCYIPKSFSNGGQWNGVDYQKEIVDGEYEHLAIVPNPRYEESVILNPEQFKKYNEDKKLELIRLANQKDEGKKSMWKFFERKKVENSVDIESMSVVLPKSKREIVISQLLNEADEAEVAKGQPRLVNASDLVVVDGEKVTVGELLEKLANAGKECMANEEEEKKEMEEEKKENEEDEKKEEEEEKENKKKNAKEPHPNAQALRNAERAHVADFEQRRQNSVSLPMDAVARGKKKYGSN